MAKQTPKPLACAVVGAGIAGLAAAIALRRAGHDVQIFERSLWKEEVGAAITITPNGNNVLDRWGFNAKAYGETDKLQSRTVDAVTLEVKQHRDFTPVPETYGHNFNAFHRVDFHKGMREMAEGLGASVLLGKAVVDLEFEDGVLTLKDGSKVRKDLVVIADGIRSSFIETVSGSNAQPRKTGKSVFRGLVPVETLMQDPLIRSIYENQPSGFFSTVSETGVFFMTYPDEVMNVAVFQTARPGHEDDQGWNSPATNEEVTSVLGDMHPLWTAIVKHAGDEMICFPVTLRDPLPRYNRGRAILIGDAAHPMQPTHAQGACVSIEDAAALEVFFRDFDADHESTQKRCQLFSDFRVPRDNTTQIYSNAMMYHLSGIATTDEHMRTVREFYQGDMMSTDTQSWSRPYQDFWFPYDVFKQAEKALECQDKEGRLANDAVKHFYADV